MFGIIVWTRVENNSNANKYKHIGVIKLLTSYLVNTIFNKYNL